MSDNDKKSDGPDHNHTGETPVFVADLGALNELHNKGIAEGLRMAREAVQGAGIYDSGLRTRNEILAAILAKAKEFEEVRGGRK